jgi:hypothetical protein
MNMSFRAQEMLQPRAPWVYISEVTFGQQPASRWTWENHYNGNQISEYLNAGHKSESFKGSLSMGSLLPIPPTTQLSPSSVDYMNCPSSGVWYPDVACCLNYKLVGFDPFCPLAYGVLTRFYSAIPNDRKLEEAFKIYPNGCESTRENWALADSRKEKRAGWMSKEQFVTFFGIRAYPNTQLRKLCNALCYDDQKLPLSEDDVGLLFKQALYHVGPLTNALYPLWKTDLLKGECSSLKSF